MYKPLSVTIVMVLLLSSAGFAMISQSESYVIPGTNFVYRQGPEALATGGNTATISQGQNGNNGMGTAAGQAETGTLSQNATAGGQGGESFVIQNGVGSAGQEQMAYRPYVIAVYPPVPAGQVQTQEQATDAHLDETAVKNSGTGTAAGVQAFLGSQNQAIASPQGQTGEAQAVGAIQHGAASGTFCSDGTVDHCLDVCAFQSNTNTLSCGACPPQVWPLLQ
jgi:hypothetical protein